MMRHQRGYRQLSSLFFLMLTFAFTDVCFASSLCPGINYEGSLTPEFNDGEKLLLCGDTSLKDSRFQAWSQIPVSQAVIHLKAFLQARAYLNPVIELKGDQLFFNPGTKAKVARIEVRGAPPELKIERRRNNVGTKLTPEHLTAIETWTQSELLYQGYPCAKVKTIASSLTDNVLVQIESGSKQTFGPIDFQSSKSDKPFDPLALQRFFPFRSEDEYDQTLLQVAEDRALTEGFVEQLKFVSTCTETPAKTRSLYVLGAPKILSYAFMLNTELWAELQATYRRTRLDPPGSFFDVSAVVSARVQQFSAFYRWFFETGRSRSLRPLFFAAASIGKTFRFRNCSSSAFLYGSLGYRARLFSFIGLRSRDPVVSHRPRAA